MKTELSISSAARGAKKAAAPEAAVSNVLDMSKHIYPFPSSIKSSLRY